MFDVTFQHATILADAPTEEVPVRLLHVMTGVALMTTLSACGSKPDEAAAPAAAAATQPSEDPFEAKLQQTTDPDELLKLADNSGGMAAAMKNRKVSARMAELMDDKFKSATSTSELYKQYKKYAMKGKAEMAYESAKQALENKGSPPVAP